MPDMIKKTTKEFFCERNWPRVLAAIILLLAGLYFGNLALFNIWQSAFQDNAPYLDVLQKKVWLFVSLSLVSIVASITIAVLTVKKVNRESRAGKIQQ